MTSVQQKNSFVCCLNFFIILVLLTGSSFAVLDSPVEPWLLADWVQTEKGLCLGHYVEPKQQHAPHGEYQIHFDEGTLRQHGWSDVQGHLQILSDEQEILARRGSFERNAQGEITTVRIADQVHVRQKGIQLFAENAAWWPKEQRFQLQNIHYHLYETGGRGDAREASQKEDGPYQFRDVSYTTCSPHQNSWALFAHKLTLNPQTKRAVAKHAKLYIKNIPVLYSPYFSFPLSKQRESGWLAPAFRQDSEAGNSLFVPYYWNINPQTDATLSPFWTTQRGWGLAQEWRYASATNKSAFTIGWFPYDRKFANYRAHELLSPSITNPLDPRLIDLIEARAHRLNFSGIQSFQFSPHWSGYWAYQGLSDDNVWEDFHSIFPMMPLNTPPAPGSQAPTLNLTTIDRSYLVRAGELRYDATRSHGYLRAQRLRALSRYNWDLLTEPYQLMPSIGWEQDWSTEPLFTHTLIEWTRFDHVPDPFTRIKPTWGHRAHFAPTLNWPIENNWGHFTPEWTWDTRQYALHVAPGDPYPTSRHLAIPVASLDTGLNFERHFSWRGGRYTQTLEPNLFFLSVPWVDQSDLPIFDASPYGWDFGSLTRTNRYSGADRLGDTRQISWRIRTRFLSTLDGGERVSAGVGQIQYLKKPQLILPGEPMINGHQSPILAQVLYHLDPAWSLALEHAYDVGLRNPVQTNLRFDYQPSPFTRVQSEFLYIYRGDPETNDVGDPGNLRQWNTSLTFPLSTHFSLWGFWRYDLTHKRILERFLGFGYENCCWAIRAGMDEERRPLILGNRRVHHFFIQFTLTGLTGFGNGFHEYMASRLSGWADPFGKPR